MLWAWGEEEEKEGQVAGKYTWPLVHDLDGGSVENSTDAYAEHSRSKLVKELHKKVIAVKQDQRMEVEYMTLLERDREKFEEGIEQGIEKEKHETAKRMLSIKLPIETIIAATGLSKDEIEKLMV